MSLLNFVQQPSLLAAEEPRVMCIIKHGNNANNRKPMNLPISTTCSQLIADVGKEFCLPTDAFELVYELPVSSSDEQHQVLIDSSVSSFFL